MQSNNKKMMTASILSLSLLTVMAGAAVAPALGTIREHFNDFNDTVIQLIISMPALFIFLSSFVFPKLCASIKSRTLVMIGLLLYVVGGCGAYFFDNIWIVLIFRAVVGMGVGIIMPLSTGLLTYYYPPNQIDRLMGLSSAMNQMGGAVATFIAGILSTVSWNATFLVYLMGLISVVLCAIFLPNDKIVSNDVKSDEDVNEDKGKNSFKQYFIYVISMFVLMSIFFIYPSNYAITTASDGFLSQEGISLVMALTDIVAFFGGLCFVVIKRLFKGNAHYVAPILFLIGNVLLAITTGCVLSIIGSFLIGFANGVGIPCIIASASSKAGKKAVSTVMPLLTGALYIAQFLSPFIMSAVNATLGGLITTHLAFYFASVLSVVFVLIAIVLKREDKNSL